MTTTHVYLLTAAAGNIGRRLVPCLLAKEPGARLVLPTTNPSRLQSQVDQLHMHASSRVHIVNGDVHDPLFVELILKQHAVSGVFICLTGLDELVVTLNLLDAIRRAQTVQHVVYLSTAGQFGLEAIQKDGVLRHNAAGHILVKHIVEAKLQHGLPCAPSEPGGFTWTVIGPTLFYDNDFRTKKSLLDKGFFDEPLGRTGVSRVDPGDIALAVAHALQDSGKVWGGKKIMIGSLERYTNADVARLWSKALGKEISYLKSDTKGFARLEQDWRGKAGLVWARDVALMYEFFDADGFGMDETEYRDQVALLGTGPTSYEEFVRKTAEEWKAERKQ